MLTDEEQTTLETYNNIAPQWVSKTYILDFWLEEYKTFQSFLPEGKIIDLGCGGGGGIASGLCNRVISILELIFPKV